jgi:N4-gp56 family major capsid protein
MRFDEDAWITSGNTLEGNESSLVTHSATISLEQYRAGIRDDGALTRQRAVFSITDESEMALRDAISEKLDNLCFAALNTSLTKTFYGGDATSTSDIAATDLLTPELVDKVSTWAKTGGGRGQTPLRGIKIGGRMYYVLLCYPDVLFDWRRNSEYAQAVREAQVRGKENPLFQDATAVWGNVIIHESEHVTVHTDWGAGSDVAGADCLLLGAQAGILAESAAPKIIRKTFDYDNEVGYAADMILKYGKPTFNSKDYGVVGVKVARTNVAGA